MCPNISLIKLPSKNLYPKACKRIFRSQKMCFTNEDNLLTFSLPLRPFTLRLPLLISRCTFRSTLSCLQIVQCIPVCSSSLIASYCEKRIVTQEFCHQDNWRLECSWFVQLYWVSYGGAPNGSIRWPTKCKKRRLFLVSVLVSNFLASIRSGADDQQIRLLELGEIKFWPSNAILP